MVNKGVISGALNGLVVITAFVFMVLAMRAVVAGSWIEKETKISGNEVTAIVTYIEDNNVIQHKKEKLALGEPATAMGLGSCGLETDACSIADLLENLSD